MFSVVIALGEQYMAVLPETGVDHQAFMDYYGARAEEVNLAYLNRWPVVRVSRAHAWMHVEARIKSTFTPTLWKWGTVSDDIEEALEGRIGPRWEG